MKRRTSNSLDPHQGIGETLNQINKQFPNIRIESLEYLKNIVLFILFTFVEYLIVYIMFNFKRILFSFLCSV